MCPVQCNHKTFELHLEIEAAPSPAWAYCQPCPLQWRGRGHPTAWPWPCFHTLHCHLLSCVAKMEVEWERKVHTSPILLWTGFWHSKPGVFLKLKLELLVRLMSFQRPASCPPLPSLCFPLTCQSLWMMCTPWLALVLRVSPCTLEFLLTQNNKEASHHLPLWVVRLTAHHQLLKIVL